MSAHAATPLPSEVPLKISYARYDAAQEPKQLEAIRQLISSDLSEPYSIYVYRYFLYQWGNLCYMAMDGEQIIGVVVSKLEEHRNGVMRGYIAMLAVKEQYRGKGIATKLVQMAIDAMIFGDADEVALETEITNTAAIKLYERLGFLRSKRLHRYYLNGNSAFRLLLPLKSQGLLHEHEEHECGEDDGHDHGHDHGHGHGHDHAGEECGGHGGHGHGHEH
ncbi:acyl-CoA N-acyltransferase [Morchella conica CCBAS932]|uniref:N-terminal methionine N(alpha)-acetyltransferase NatC n=1 Tax=Morchella conica CCBAS932 TaxID=1392247 RepID=A0A3N4KGW6_9PEZI|nr:acyl-CoA N-acyltransferase [Morchella conica CCBAS932]